MPRRLARTTTTTTTTIQTAVLFFLLLSSSLLPYPVASFALPTGTTSTSTSSTTTTTSVSATTATTTTTMNDKAINIPVDVLATHANSYASAHGIQVERRHDKNDPKKGGSYFECAPMSLLPNAYPQSAFQMAQIVAPYFNELVERISQDSTFLQDTLGGGVSDADPFTAKLLQLYKEIYVNDNNDADGGNFAKLADRLGIHRSDYMLHSPSDGSDYQLKQVELNTIAASFAGLAVNTANLHRHLTSRFQSDVKEFLISNQKIVLPNNSHDDNDAPGVPENPALERLPNAMKVAHERYMERFVTTKKRKLNENEKQEVVILFVVQDGETNTVDQRMLEFQLWNTHQIPVVRMSLTRAATELVVNSDTGALSFVDSGQEVSVVYYRAGYAPTDYPDGYDGIEWKARTLLEKSRATKAPSLGYHLAGTKKVQQELARPGVVERFFPTTTTDNTNSNNAENAKKVQDMRSVFAGLYSLGEDATPEDLAAVQDVLENSQQGQYVLKPQREGGGYNFYGDQLFQKLQENTSKKTDDGDGPSTIQLGKVLAEFILMQRLFPPQQRVVLMRNGKVEGSGDAVSELGCFGTLVVSHDGTICHNEYSGFLLRTKFANVDEGGVASGFATLSSPYLC